MSEVDHLSLGICSIKNFWDSQGFETLRYVFLVMNISVEIPKFEKDRNCAFCKRNTVDEFHFGKIYKYNDITVHYFCLLFASHLQQNGVDEEGILGFLISDIKKEIRNKKKTQCKYCRLPGATVVCSRKCTVKFHYPCGIENNSFHIFSDTFPSYCYTHRRKQHTPIPVTFSMPEICIICQTSIDPVPSMSNIWASCCKTAWYHKICLQRLALSSGYFFKCPNCNCQDKFRREMISCGIYIPDQDAAWETDADYFRELTERYNNCDANKCLCPSGNSFSRINGPWEIILCNTCGSQGIHKKCGSSLLNRKGEWICGICSSVVASGKENKYSLTLENSTVAWMKTSPRRNRKRSSSNSNTFELQNFRKTKYERSYEHVRRTKTKKGTKSYYYVRNSSEKQLVPYEFDGIRVKIPSGFEKMLKEFHIFLTT